MTPTEIAALLRQAADEIEQLDARYNDYAVVTCGPECSEHHTYVAPCALDGDVNTLAAARAYWRRSHR